MVATPARIMIPVIIHPKEVATLLFAQLPIILLLLLITTIRTKITGEINPFKTAE